MRARRGVWGVLLILALVPAATARAQPAGTARELRIAVDPILPRSGLLEQLVPKFEAARGLHVVIRALPAREALELGASGGVDLVWVSAPRLEVQYLNQGFYLDRRHVLYTDQVLVGPPGDSAGVRGSKDTATAFRRLARHAAPFVSRGERAETRALELEIWKRARVTPRAPWYLQTDAGKDEALALAASRGAYMLVDRAAADPFVAKGQLQIVLQGMRPLRRGYYAMVVNPNRFPKVNHTDAQAFADYLVSPAAQETIQGVDLDQDGKRDFFPGAGRTDP